MALFPTNAAQVQTFATALYGVQVGTTTMAQVTADIAAAGGLNNALNAYYSASFGSATTASVAATIVANVGLAADANAIAFVTAQLNAAAPAARGAAVIAMLDAFLSTTTGTYAAAATAFNTTVATAVAYTGAANVVAGTANPVAPQTFTLKVSADTLVGGTGVNTFDASTNDTFSAFDNLTGGAGANTLNANFTGTALPGGTAVSGIQTANLYTTAAGFTADVSSSTNWTGLTALNVVDSAAGAQTITAKTTTAVTSSFVSGSSTFNGGSTVAVSTTALGNAETLTVGGTTAPLGNVTIAARSATGTSTGTIAVTTGSSTATGGSTVSITESGATTQTRAFNVTDGYVTAAKAGTLANVTLDGYGASSLITSNALSNLTLANSTSAATNVTITNTLTSALTAKTSVLNLTVNNLTGATTLVDTNNEIGTLNVTTATKDSTITAITDSSLAALTVSGTNKLTLGSTTGLGATFKTLTVTGAAAFTLAADLSANSTAVTTVDTTGTTGIVTLGSTTATKGFATSTTFTGGAGNDIITVGATTKAITLGNGANTVYMLSGTTALGTGGSITAGGTGIDTLSMVVADAVTASGTTTFGSVVTGFDRLTLAAATATQSVDVTNLGINGYVTVTGGASALTLANVLVTGNGGTVVISGANAGGLTLNGTGAWGTGTADKINITLSNSGAALAAFGTVVATGIETVAINSLDAQTTPVGYLNTATLTDTSVKSIVLTGNSGLNLSYSGTTLTSFDASAVALPATTSLAGAVTFSPSGQLAASSTIVGSATNANTMDLSALNKAGTFVTYTGGAAVDTINLNNGLNNVVSLGGGADILTIGSGMNTITLGAGSDTVNVIVAPTNGNAYSTITDIATGDTISFSAIGNGTISTTVPAKISLAATAAFADYINAATASATANTNSVLNYFAYAGDTYVVLDNSSATTFSNGVDEIVKLVGAATISTISATGVVVFA